MTAIAAREPEQQLWRAIYDHLYTKPYGYLATYTELETVLGREVQTTRYDIYRASKEMGRTVHRTLVCVRGEGYRIAEPKEHEGLALDRQRYARRHIRRGQDIINYTDRTQLTIEENKRLTDLETHMGRVNQALRSHGRQIHEVQNQLTLEASRIADLEARLSRLERFKETPSH